MNCNVTYTNVKQWTIYQTNQITGVIQTQIFLTNNPTINYAQLVLQPGTLAYGLYRIFYTVNLLDSNGALKFSSSVDTFIQVVPSGLVLSTLKTSQPMYGGTIQISRGQNQKILFDPFLFTYDVDNVAVITELTFTYACQVIDSNVPQGYPKVVGTNQTISLSSFKTSPSLLPLMTCFNSTSITL